MTRAFLLLLVLALTNAQRPLDHGDVIDQHTEWTNAPEWVSTGWDWELTLAFDPTLHLEWREVELGYWRIPCSGPPLRHFLELQCGQRVEWIEVDECVYSEHPTGSVYP